MAGSNHPEEAVTLIRTIPDWNPGIPNTINGGIALKSMILVSDTISDTLPYYLKVGGRQVVPESWQMSFGQYDFFPLTVPRFSLILMGEPPHLCNYCRMVPLVLLPFSPWIHSVFFFSSSLASCYLLLFFVGKEQP